MKKTVIMSILTVLLAGSFLVGGAREAAAPSTANSWLNNIVNEYNQSGETAAGRKVSVSIRLIEVDEPYFDAIPTRTPLELVAITTAFAFATTSTGVLIAWGLSLYRAGDFRVANNKIGGM